MHCSTPILGINILSFICFICLFITSCAQSNEGEVAPLSDKAASPVEFSVTLSNVKPTRATYPNEYAIGGITTDRLKEQLSFGVFTQYAGNTAWSSYTAKSTTPFNFMWNQQVDWNDGLTAWTYTPVKYWPNDNNPADDKGATGSQTHSFLDFFAYAPYTEVAAPATGFDVKDVDGNSDGKPDHDGIVKILNNSTNIEDSYIYYRTSNDVPFDADESVDLLWATKRDCYKTDAAGYGYVDGKVNLVFKHALSLFTVAVQGLFDHVDNDDTSTTYPDDRDIFTKILIEMVDFSGSPIFKEGKMYIAPNPDTADVPHWEIDDADGNSDGTPDLQYDIIVEGEDVNPTLANRYLDGTWKKYWDEDDIGESVPANLKSFLQLSDQDDDGDVDADDALAIYNQLPKGVSHTEVPLNYTNYDSEKGKYEDYWYMVLPNDEYRTANPAKKIQVRMVYYVITYDTRLTLVKTGYPKYFSIVKNNITATFDSFSFAPNKKYKLLMQPGLTSCKFEVTMVDGWDTPITIDPEVVDWYSTPIEYNVE